MTSLRGRVFLEADRKEFFDAIVKMRETCVEVQRRAPVGGLDYLTARELVIRLDDAVEALTGDRQTLWQKPHSSPKG